MRQVAHILRKDVEHLWPVCVQVLLLAALHAFYATRLAHPGGGIDISGPLGLLGLFAGLSAIMLPLAIGAMTVVVIQEEPLTGTNAFWLTRPYSRTALLFEKIVFVSLFGLAPLVVHDVYIVSYFQLGSLGAAPVIAFEIIEFAAILLCAAAAAVLTPTFARFGALTLGVVIAFWFSVAALARSTNDWGPLTGVPGLLACVIAVTAAFAVVLHQYRTRRVRWSAALGGAGLIATALVLSLFSWRTAWAMRSFFGKPTTGLERVQLDPALDSSDAVIGSEVDGSIALPFRITGCPANISLETFRADGELMMGPTQVRLGALSLPVFRSGDLDPNERPELAAHSQFVSFAPALGSFLRQNRERPVTVSGSFYFQAYRDLPTARLRIDNQNQAVRMGRQTCGVVSGLDLAGKMHVTLNCVEFEPASGIQISASVVSAEGAPIWNDSPSQSGRGPIGPDLFPAVFTPVHLNFRHFSFEPVRALEPAAMPAGASVALTAREPAGLLRRDFRISSARLGDLEPESWRKRRPVNPPAQ